MRLIGALNFYTKYIEKLHINLKPLNDQLNENNLWFWTTEHETSFQNFKNALISDTELTIPNTKHPFLLQSMLHRLDSALSFSIIMK